MAIPGLSKARKYPFIFAFFLMLLFVAVLLVSNSQPPFPITASFSPPDQLLSDAKTSLAADENSIPHSSEMENVPFSGDPAELGLEYSPIGSPVPGDLNYSSVPSSTNDIIPSDTISDVPKKNKAPSSSDSDAVHVPIAPPEKSLPSFSGFSNVPIPIVPSENSIRYSTGFSNVPIPIVPPENSIRYSSGFSNVPVPVAPPENSIPASSGFNSFAIPMALPENIIPSSQGSSNVSVPISPPNSSTPSTSVSNNFYAHIAPPDSSAPSTSDSNNFYVHIAPPDSSAPSNSDSNNFYVDIAPPDSSAPSKSDSNNFYVHIAPPGSSTLSFLSGSNNTPVPIAPPDNRIPSLSDSSTVPLPLAPPDNNARNNNVFVPIAPPVSSTLSSSNPKITPISHTLPSDDISSTYKSSITNLSSTGNAATPTSVTAAINDSLVVNVDWKLCKGPVAVDYIPCLDNWDVIKRLKSRKRMEHRERHCPQPSLRCLIPLPQGYRIPVQWPKSREMVWYNNVPHPKLVEYKKNQRWVMKRGEYFYFPGGGTQFSNGVNFYINSIQKTLPAIEWGNRTRVVLDVGCGVASFGGALLDKNVITMSMAPKDEHEAQIQFALERGIPATLAVIGTQRLKFPDNSFDLIHCARCRVHWDGDGGKPLMELNRILMPGGYFVWSATPVYKKDERHRGVWKSMVALTESLCWTTVGRSYFRSSHIGLVIYQKPASPSCYQKRKQNKPPMCNQSSRLNSSWYTPLDGCLMPFQGNSIQWPSPWPERLMDKPPRLPKESGAEETFKQDTRQWSSLVSKVYLGALGVNWLKVRNVMDMNAGYGGFAAALINHPVWVMNVVPIHEPDTLQVILDRGLIGMSHDWCESFDTYPRTYDLLHSSFLFGILRKRCDVFDIAVEIDRMLRPDGYLIVQDNMEILVNLNPVLKSLHWSTEIHQDQFLVGKKGFWRPVGAARV